MFVTAIMRRAAVRLAPRVATRAGGATTAMRWFAAKPTEDASKKAQSSQSILTDDMLAKAGFDDDPKKAFAEGSATEGAEGAEGAAEGSGDADAEVGDRSARRKRRAQTSKDLQRERYANWFYISLLVGAVAGAGYLARDWDSAEEQQRLDSDGAIAGGYSPSLVYGRFNKRLGLLFTFFQEPAFENLLPPPAPEAYRRPLTLVLTLDDLLIHSEWDTKHGWRTAKRPGLDYFLGYLLQYYEIVIFGLNLQMFSEKAVSKLDPLHAYVSYALYREACRYKDGKLIKDLLLLNRDLGKTILVDVSPELWALQPENAIPMQPWDGKPDDTLIKLIPFLEYLATQPVKDVRPILNSFGDKLDVIGEFAKREEQLRLKWRQENAHLFKERPNAGTFLALLMGVPLSQVQKQPKMPLDVIREHGQMQYEHFQKYLKENAPKFMEEEQKLKEEFGKTTLNKLMTEGAPSPEAIAKMQAERAEAEKAGL